MLSYGSARPGVPDLGRGEHNKKQRLELNGLSCVGAHMCMFIVHSWNVGNKELTEKIRTLPSRKVCAKISLRREGIDPSGSP